jgi:hypothetical protein
VKSAELTGERIVGVGQERQNSTGSSDGLTGHSQVVGTDVGLGVVGRFLDGDDAPIHADEAGEVGASLFQKAFEVCDLTASLAELALSGPAAELATERLRATRPKRVGEGGSADGTGADVDDRLALGLHRRQLSGVRRYPPHSCR